jgi:hypothetical protein
MKSIIPWLNLLVLALVLFAAFTAIRACNACVDNHAQWKVLTRNKMTQTIHRNHAKYYMALTEHCS